jgi:hypothetical protein
MRRASNMGEELTHIFFLIQDYLLKSKPTLLTSSRSTFDNYRIQ